MYGRIPKGEELEALIFDLNSEAHFVEAALSLFHFQYQNNEVYRGYCNQIGRGDTSIERLEDVPFLPISFFKGAEVTTTQFQPEIVFQSSGTTGQATSSHFVKRGQLYERSFFTAFEAQYGPVNEYAILGLLPSYIEKGNSSLVYMVQAFMNRSGHPSNAFFLHNYEELSDVLKSLINAGQKVLLIGVTYALLDFAMQYPQPLPGVVIMETGGMKGRGREVTREEVHAALKEAFKVSSVHSEYGMTELLSQAYATSSGFFRTPRWMKILLRPEDDPLSVKSHSPKVATGVINIIDLANIWSCSFIATDDVGRLHPDGSFEVLGRLDNADIRGCSLLAI